MRGKGVKNIVAENVLAAMPLVGARQIMNRKRRLCWACQQDKVTTGGHIKIVPGLMKFVCAECMDAKKVEAQT
jgi:hypothetical protein